MGISFPRMPEYRMTKNTPEGWALREQAKILFDEEKEEQWFYKEINNPAFGLKKHEYYWWWQMQGEPWIFRIKAFSQFTRDILAYVVLYVYPFIVFPYIIFYQFMGAHFDFDQMIWFYIIYPPLYFWILCQVHVYEHLNYYRTFAWKYFHYHDGYREAAGPRIENPGTWEYYYYIITNKFPEKYRLLQDEHMRQLKIAVGKDPDAWFDEDTDSEEMAEFELDQVTGGHRVDLDNYDSTGGEDLTLDNDPELDFFGTDDTDDTNEPVGFREDYNPEQEKKAEEQDLNRKKMFELIKEYKSLNEKIDKLEKEQPNNKTEIDRLTEQLKRVMDDISALQKEIDDTL